MKLRIDATTEELGQKAPELVGELADVLQFINPEIADVLAKAVLPRKEHELKYPALRGLQKKVKDIYVDHLNRMIADIEKVLDQSTQKSEVSHGNDQNGNGSRHLVAGLFEAVQHGTEALRGSPGAGSGNTSDRGVSETMANNVQGLVESEGDQAGGSGNHAKKSYEMPGFVKARKATQDEIDAANSGKLSEPLRHDHTKKITEQDQRSYIRVKTVLIRRGYTESDFEEGGALYGYSVNELIDLIRKK